MWREDSTCRKHPTEWWFGASQSDTALAKSICSGCGVQAPCLEFALSRPDLLGIWAATTPADRTRLRRSSRDPLDALDVATSDTEIRHEAIAAEVELIIEREAERESERETVPSPLRATRKGSRRRAPDVSPDDRDDLLTPAEAARKLGVTPNTVTRWSRAGKISAIQTMGGHRRFRRAEIDRVLEDASLLATAPR